MPLFLINFWNAMSLQGRRKFFYGWACWVKSWVTDDENFLKFPKLRHPKIVPIKQNLYQKINNLKPHIWTLSIDFRFSGRKSQSHHKLAKKITHFTIQFCSKNLTHFTNLNSLKIRKRYSCNTVKKTLTHFTNFPANTFVVSVRKKTFALHNL